MPALTDAHSSVIALHSVPWNDYSNVPCFKTQSELDSYFNVNQVVQYTQMTYIRNDATYRVQMDINTFKENHINYMTFDNGSGREYAFVRNPRFVDLNCTEFDIETDVWVTYMFKHDVSGIVERAHVDRWDSNGRPIIYRGDSNNVGNMRVTSNDYYGSDVIWCFMFVTDWIEDFIPSNRAYPKRIGSAPNAFPLYIFPIIVHSNPEGAYPTEINFTPNVRIGASGTVYSSGMGNSKIFESPNIISIQMHPFVPFLYTVTEIDGEECVSINDPSFDGEFLDYSGNQLPPLNGQGLIAANSIPDRFRNSVLFDTWDSLPTMPSHNSPMSYEYESRLYYAPYTTIKLNNWSSTLELNPADFPSGSVSVSLILALGAGDYNVNCIVTNWSEDEYGVNYQIPDNTLKMLGWKTDAYQTYMQMNSAQIQAAHSRNTSNLAMSLVSNAVSMGMSGIALAAGVSKTDSAVMSEGTNITSGIIGIGQSVMDYTNTKNAIDAKITDMKNAPDTASLSSGSPGTMIGNMRNKITCQHMRAHDYALELYGSIFIKYGYELNIMATNFDIRSRYWYNFIKYKAPVCTSAQWLVPEHKTALERMYAAGFTAWHHTATAFSQFGKYNLDNTEVSIDGA